MVDRRGFLIACAGLAAVPRTFALQPKTPGAAPDSWPQFRGSSNLCGVSQTTIAASPKVAWVWEGGEAFDSSAAIVDGVVYVGTATGELIAVGLGDGKLR